MYIYFYNVIYGSQLNGFKFETDVDFARFTEIQCAVAKNWVKLEIDSKIGRNITKLFDVKVEPISILFG